MSATLSGAKNLEGSRGGPNLSNDRGCRWSGVPRLVHAELSASRQSHFREVSPRLVVHWPASHALLFHVRHEAFEVIAHEVELLHVVFFRRVHGHLCRRQSEDEPSSANVDVRKFQHFAKKRAVRVGILAVDDGVRTDDHPSSLVEFTFRSDVPDVRCSAPPIYGSVLASCARRRRTRPAETRSCGQIPLTTL